MTRGQLRDAGLSDDRVDGLLAGGALERRAVGVFLVRGAPATYEAQLFIAVLSTRGVLGHATAAHLWGVLEAPPAPITVVVPRHRRIAAPAAVRLRRTDLPRSAIDRRHGLPVTTRTWTLLDHLGDLPVSAAVQLADRALQCGWLTRADVERRVDRHAGRRGTPVLRRVLALIGDGAAAESERVLHRLLHRAGISGWTANQDLWVDGYLAAVGDVVFDAARLVIEVDGLAHHSSPDRFQRDRTRQNALVAAGWTVLRFTWQDVTGRPGYVVASIGRQLARAA